MKKIIGLSILAIMLIALAGGGTLAFFNDTGESQDNSILAGTLDLTLNKDAFFTTQAQYTNIKPGNPVSHEYIKLDPDDDTNHSTIVTENYLSIRMKNMWLDKSGFNALASAGRLHNMNGVAYQASDAGDFGKKLQTVFWLSQSSSSTPSPDDIVLVPAIDGGGTGTFNSLFGGFSTWAALFADDDAANFTFAGYFDSTAPVESPTSTNTSTFDWNNVLVTGSNPTGAMGTNIWYFHVTHYFPDSGDDTDNVYQAEKVYADFYFTLATVTDPY